MLQIFSASGGILYFSAGTISLRSESNEVEKRPRNILGFVAGLFQYYKV
jgi:hypothetical protein